MPRARARFWRWQAAWGGVLVFAAASFTPAMNLLLDLHHLPRLDRRMPAAAHRPHGRLWEVLAALADPFGSHRRTPSEPPRQPSLYFFSRVYMAEDPLATMAPLAAALLHAASGEPRALAGEIFLAARAQFAPPPASLLAMAAPVSVQDVEWADMFAGMLMPDQLLAGEGNKLWWLPVPEHAPENIPALPIPAFPPTPVPGLDCWESPAGRG